MPNWRLYDGLDPIPTFVTSAAKNVEAKAAVARAMLLGTLQDTFDDTAFQPLEESQAETQGSTPNLQD